MANIRQKINKMAKRKKVLRLYTMNFFKIFKKRLCRVKIKNKTGNSVFEVQLNTKKILMMLKII